MDDAGPLNKGTDIVSNACFAMNADKLTELVIFILKEY